YRPAPISFIEPIACDEGLSMATDPNDPETPFDDRATCESETLLVDNTGRILAIGGISAVVALGAYTLRHRIRPRSLSAPTTPAHA
ncbi:MAG TPA: hypothetical protein VHK88_08985, partial [Aquihabitans sp.]|nr:hypothetical protein [Aquihabitans sp.]